MRTDRAGALPAKCSLYVYIAGTIVAIHVVEHMILERSTNKSDASFNWPPTRGTSRQTVQMIAADDQRRKEVKKHDLPNTPGKVISRFKLGERYCSSGVCFSDVMEIEKPDFDPNFKNPCWYQQKVRTLSQTIEGNGITRITKHLKLPDGGPEFLRQINDVWLNRRGRPDQLRCLPYFIIIGQPKSGSTDLYARLSLHQQITLSLLKEPQWYSWKKFISADIERRSRRFTYKDNIEIPITDYVAIFDKQADEIEQANYKGSQIVTGDGSSNLLHWNLDWELYEGVNNSKSNILLPEFTLADHVKSIQPDVKLLLILRNPTERLYSAYQYFPHKSDHNKSVEDFHRDVLHDVQLFKTCRSERNSRSCGYDRRLFYQFNLQITAGLYSVFIQDWLKVFPRSQLKVINFDEYKKDTLPHMDSVIEFLELDPIVGPLRQRIANLKPHQVNKVKLGPMLDKTKKILDKFYGPYNQQLADMLGEESFIYQSNG